MAGGDGGDAPAGDGGHPPADADDTDIDELGPFREVRRRAVHVSGVLVPVPHVLAPDLVPWRYVVWFCLAGAALAAVLEVLRLGGRVQWRIFEELTREYEADNPAGYALYAVGYAAVAVALGPAASPRAVPLAVPAMLMLAIGDPISGLLGSTGAEGVKDTYVLAAMFAVCLAVALPLVSPVAAVAGALVATVADGVKPVVWGYVVDDNVTIPVGAGAAMWLATAVA
jgi:dolichol kinase